MEVFYHNLYELQKGLRGLALCTLKEHNKDKIVSRLNKEAVSYHINPIGEGKINVFFGEKACVDIIKSFNKVFLTDFTPEEDFILGIMLGYDRLKQCERYLNKNSV